MYRFSFACDNSCNYLSPFVPFFHQTIYWLRQFLKPENFTKLYLFIKKRQITIS